MYTLFIQVAEEDFEAYISELDAHGFNWSKETDFTPIGRWCLVKVVTEQSKDRDLAEALYC